MSTGQAQRTSRLARHAGARAPVKRRHVSGLPSASIGSLRRACKQTHAGWVRPRRKAVTLPCNPAPRTEGPRRSDRQLRRLLHPAHTALISTLPALRRSGTASGAEHTAAITRTGKSHATFRRAIGRLHPAGSSSAGRAAGLAPFPTAFAQLATRCACKTTPGATNDRSGEVRVRPDVRPRTSLRLTSATSARQATVMMIRPAAWPSALAA
jgi:hypothetical protein